jgi:uroporphyrinogen decarboxylase
MKNLFFDALSCKNEDRPPLWLMRQAGRYLPSYRALRGRYSLETLFHHPELAAQVTLQPFEYFPFDASILFSDILLLLEAFDFNVVYPQEGGPFIENPPINLHDLARIKYSNVEERLSFVAETIRLLRKKLQVPLLGFCGAPVTLAAYLLGRPSKDDLKPLKSLLYQHPEEMEIFLQKIARASAEYLRMQIQAGAQAIQIFESWAGALPYELFVKFSLPFLKTLVDCVKENGVPVILFCRGSSLWVNELAELNPTAISFDTQGDLPSLASRVPKSIAIQGNLDPLLLLQHPDLVEEKARKLMQSMMEEKRFIMNLGHGVLPESRLDSIKRLVEVSRSAFSLTS